MDAFTDYIHVTENIELANSILPRCEYHLNTCVIDGRYQGHQTTFFQKELIDDIELNELYDYLILESIQFCTVVGIDVDQIKPNIDSLWISNMGLQGNHPYHTHSPGSHLSGTFYVQTDTESSPINFLSRFFYNDIWYNLPFSIKNQYSAPSVRFLPKPGRLLIWKSDLIHGVVDNKTSTRIAVSFNITLQRK